MAISFSVQSEISDELTEKYKQILDKMNLQELVKEFFSYLDYKEESESGVEFNPITIGSCRVLMTRPLEMCLRKLREKIE